MLAELKLTMSDAIRESGPVSNYWRQWEQLQQLRATPKLLEMASETHGSEMKLQRRLRAEFPQDLVPAALSLVELRRKAAEKFSLAASMWLDRQGLQQATSEAIARHKAQRFSGPILDLCCGIGADSIALSAKGDVVAVDRNPAACLRAQWNAQAAGCGDRIQLICAEAEQIPPGDRLVHIDPDRRANRPSRSIRLEDSSPSLQFLQELPSSARGGAMKLSPAANFGGKFPGCETELVSLGGECKEATVWFGELAGPKSWRATVLPQGASLSGNDLEAFAEITTLQQHLYDPDPAVVRAGLVDLAAMELSLSRLDEAEEYLTSNQKIDSPFVRGFEVLEEFPNNDKALRRYFRGSDFGCLEIKCRHIPIQVESLRRKLTLPGNEPGVLIFARVGGKAKAVVCRRIDRQTTA